MTDDEELIEQVARAICVANGCDPDTMFEGSPIWDHWEDDAKAAIATINLPALSAWRNAVIDELTSLHIYSAEHDADPRKAVRDIVEWNQRLALDPAVSAEARALMVRGGEMVKEAAARENLMICLTNCEELTDEAMEALNFATDRIRALSVPAIVEAGDA